jgi:murein DD-endopeptidase MepM/ murein hydrolase activator NlpD
MKAWTSWRPPAPILAAAGGVVVAAEWHNEYGNMIDIDHGNGLKTRYAHASKSLVRAGDIVRPGQMIAGSAARGARPARTCTSRSM